MAFADPNYQTMSMPMMPMLDYQHLYFQPAFDPSAIFYNPSHARSSSSVSTLESSIEESAPESACSRLTPPPRACSPIRSHGALLLPRIRPQDQQIGGPAASVAPMPKKRRATSAGVSKHKRAASAQPVRSKTSQAALAQVAMANAAYITPPPTDRKQQQQAAAVPVDPGMVTYQHLYQPFDFDSHRRASSVSSLPASYRHMSSEYMPELFEQAELRCVSPESLESSPEPTTPSTTLLNYLAASNPAASLVRSISFPMRDPSIKHFWWDIRSVRPWTAFNLNTILSLPGASDLLTTPVPSPLLPAIAASARHPETEAALHGIYASYYLPKLNAALAVTSNRPVQIAVPSRVPEGVNDLLFVASAAHDPATAAAMFGGKPSARVVGIVRSFDRFNTGMRAEGNIKRVEYLRGLSAVHHAMREHGCRYGFILTEIELVVVRNGVEGTPFFGELEIASVQLATSSETPSLDSTPFTACLALWGLCQVAGDNVDATGQAHYRSDIGAPEDATRRKARAKDSWIPQPQLAEKREAKRSRGWVWPEDPIAKKEVGKRRVKYSAN